MTTWVHLLVWKRKQHVLSSVVNLWCMILYIVFTQTQKCKRAKAGAGVGKRIKLAFSQSECGPFRGFHRAAELKINGTRYEMKMALLFAFGSLQDFLTRKDKNRSTKLCYIRCTILWIKHRIAADVRLASQAARYFIKLFSFEAKLKTPSW